MEAIPTSTVIGLAGKRSGRWRKLLQNYQLYIFVLPALIYFVVFCYVPMYGVIIAFKDFHAGLGIWNSPWAGLEHFERFFDSFYFGQVIRNTVTISLLSLAVGFPIPIILALMLNEVRSTKFKRLVQTITYAPHFISVVVLVGMLMAFLSTGSGIINNLLKFLGFQTIDFLQSAQWFKPIYVLSGVWQNAGWSAIIFLAALAGIDPQQYEAATMDGATRFHKIVHINIPGIAPTIIIMLIMNVGQVMNVGFEKVFLMQNPLNADASEVISTYVYKSGLLNAQYSFSAAVGLFNSVINFILLIIVNYTSKKINETSLW
ncbi:MAG: sugar transporter permease [Paenibacillaceae bacterium]|jgi:putative aldouronate transport system permease protein|nr:sugar transporter permease [Paenibacillaceae bacterium]